MDPRRLDELEMLGGMEPPPALAEYIATEHQRSELRTLLEELERRKIEALRLYEPSPFQDRYHRCTAKECALAKGNQAGGTVAGAVEIARAVTGQDPYGKYPKKGGVAAVVGFKEEHIGRVIQPYLFLPGAFRIIQDHEGEWRTFKPWLDKGREKEARPAPPLIPARFIKEQVWEKRGKRVFNRVDLTTGWTIYAYSSRAEPSQGWWANVVWIDEDLEREDWYDEMIPRLSMAPEKTGYKGLLRWTALPHSKNDALVNLIERAEEMEEEPDPQAVVIRASIFDNPYMDETTKADNVRIWKSRGEDEYRKRALGELTMDSVLMYPEFHKDLHGAIRQPPRDGEPDLRPLVCRILTESNGIPPADWTRYLVVDPGHQVCAVAFFAVPPPSLGDFAVQYDELWITQCDARKFAEHVANKVQDQSFQRFIIDMHGGRLRGLAGGDPPHKQYSNALKEFKVASIATGHRFQPGCDDVEARQLKLHEWLHIRRDGTPRYLVVAEKCPYTLMNFRRFKKQVVKGVITDERNKRTPSHLAECLEYAAADGLPYKKPVYKPQKKTAFDRILEGRKQREAQRRAKNRRPGKSIVSLGPQGY